MRRADASILAVAAILAAAAWIAGGCRGGPKTSDRDLVLVDPEEAVELAEERKLFLGLGGKATVIWVDPRSRAEYEAGHIPGALSMPFQTVTAEHRKLGGYDVIIVYGNDYHDEKADGMSKRLMQLGHKDVRTLRGGLRTWITGGYELDTGRGE